MKHLILISLMFIGCNHTSNNETPEPKECRAGRFDLTENCIGNFRLGL